MQTNIHISIPCLNDIKVDTVVSLLEFKNYNKQHQNIRHSIGFQKNTYIHQARNQAVWDAVNANATHLLFIDSDIVFPAHAVDQLLSDNKDIVGGLYFGRIKPFPVYKVESAAEHGLCNPSTLPEEYLSQVSAVGTGFMLINMNVFKKLEPPFFYYARPSDFGMAESPFPRNELGEDVTFCLNARKVGFKVWLDRSLLLEHVGTHNYSIDDFVQMQASELLT